MLFAIAAVVHLVTPPHLTFPRRFSDSTSRWSVETTPMRHPTNNNNGDSDFDVDGDDDDEDDDE